MSRRKAEPDRANPGRGMAIEDEQLHFVTEQVPGLAQIIMKEETETEKKEKNVDEGKKADRAAAKAALNEQRLRKAKKIDTKEISHIEALRARRGTEYDPVFTRTTDNFYDTAYSITNTTFDPTATFKSHEQDAAFEDTELDVATDDKKRPPSSECNQSQGGDERYVMVEDQLEPNVETLPIDVNSQPSRATTANRWPCSSAERIAPTPSPPPVGSFHDPICIDSAAPLSGNPGDLAKFGSLPQPMGSSFYNLYGPQGRGLFNWKKNVIDQEALLRLGTVKKINITKPPNTWNGVAKPIPDPIYPEEETNYQTSFDSTGFEHTSFDISQNISTQSFYISSRSPTSNVTSPLHQQNSWDRPLPEFTYDPNPLTILSCYQLPKNPIGVTAKRRGTPSTTGRSMSPTNGKLKKSASLDTGLHKSKDAGTLQEPNQNQLRTQTPNTKKIDVTVPSQIPTKVVDVNDMANCITTSFYEKYFMQSPRWEEYHKKTNIGSTSKYGRFFLESKPTSYVRERSLHLGHLPTSTEKIHQESRESLFGMLAMGGKCGTKIEIPKKGLRPKILKSKR